MKRTEHEPNPGVKVLCVFSYYARVPTGTKRYVDSIMVEVQHSSQVIAAFLDAMEEYRADWNPNDCVNPRPTSVKLESYMPEHGRQRFGRGLWQQHEQRLHLRSCQTEL